MNTRLFSFLFNHRAIPQRLVRFIVRRPVPVQLDGFSLLVRADDFAVSLGILLRRSYEKNLTARIERYLSAGSVFLDVGANIGYYTMLAASRVGESGKVLAFEPYAGNLALLRASAARNGFTNIVTFAAAASDRAGTLAFSLDDSNGHVSLTSDSAHPLRVEAVRLDDALAGEARIDVVKMDIEGAEGLAFGGMGALLRNHHPVLFFEFAPDALRKVSALEPTGLLDRIRKSGYDLSVVDQTTAFTPLTNDEILRAFRATGVDHIDLQAVPRMS